MLFFGYAVRQILHLESALLENQKKTQSLEKSTGLHKSIQLEGENSCTSLG